jgi:hypothetical protein
MLRLTLVLALALPSFVRAQARPVANLVVGDGVVVVKTSLDGHVIIGLGSASHTAALSVRKAAVQQFVADAQALVHLGARPTPKHVLDQPVLQEDTTGRGLSLTRHLTTEHGETVVSYHFFVADERLSGFALVATPAEAKSVLGALRSAAGTHP